MTEQTKQNIIENVQTLKRPSVDIYAAQERFTIVCCKCQRWVDDERWTDSPIPEGKQSHTYCPVCYDEVMKEIEELRKARS